MRNTETSDIFGSSFTNEGYVIDQRLIIFQS